MSKNIETCKSEEVLSSVLDQQPQDYPSVQQAVHDLGVTALPAASAADPDIAELPSNVEVFVRRVLKAVVYDRVLPVVQQMWQAVLNRCSDYLPDTLRPYASNPSLRTLGTLPTAISAISVRKISNGGATNDGIKDGVSLGHILGDSSVQVTKIVDDNTGWTWNRVMNNTTFPYLEELHVGCRTNTTFVMEQNTVIRKIVFTDMVENNYAPFRITSYDGGFPNLTEVSFPKLKVGGSLIYWSLSGWWNNGLLGLTTLNLPELETIKSGVAIGNAFISGTMPSLKVLNMPKLKTLNSYLWGGNTLSGLEELHMPNLTHCNSAFTNTTYPGSPANLIDVEVGAVQTNMDIRYWNPTNVLADADKTATFLQNFLHHIAERLAVGPTTNRLTLTLSADVYSACGFGATIDDTTDIRYQIKKAIQDRNWKVTDGTNNFNQ